MKEHDIVVLETDIIEAKKGTRGTIVHDYGTGMYEVEFIVDGQSKVISIPESYLIKQ